MTATTLISSGLLVAFALAAQAGERHIAYPARVTAMPQLRGVMLPMKDVTEDDFRTLHGWGATIVRYQMVWPKSAWKDLDPDRDVAEMNVRFGTWLDGRLDHLETTVLPLAKKYGMKVCVDLHTAPGYRYSKAIGPVPEGRNGEFRMYYVEGYRKAFCDSWRKIATRFKGDPSIYGFDLINEPVQNARLPVGYWEIQQMAAQIIREIDPVTSIVVEGNHMDNPDGFKELRPIGLDNVIYQVHMYMPFLFTHQAVGADNDWKIRAAYPDAERGWDKMHLRHCLRHVREFEKRHGARIYVGEFSAVAWAKGAETYIRDCIELFNEYGWDWSYHAFREWEGWSVEHEWSDKFNTKPVPSTDNPRMRALKNGLKEKPVAKAGECRIDVDFATSAGPVKAMHAVGQPPLLGHDNTSMFHYLKEAGVPYSRLHDVGGAFARNVLVDIPNIFRDFEADENDPASYDFAFTDILINELVKNGVEPYFRLGVTIENSRKVKAYRIHPPKDFAKWARICEHVIRHYTEGWADGFRHKITYWEIWNEPENTENPDTNQMWTGTWDEYCRLYETAAKHLKAKFPHLKIGGYGSCGFYAIVPGKRITPRTVYLVDCYTNFLKHVKKTNAPLDFFSFHAYSKPKDAVSQTKWAIDTLRSYGFSDTETSLNEWHPGGGINMLGTAEQAAEICAEMIGLQQTELDNAMLYDARCGVGTYSPLFNPLTFKPHKAYYALKAFNELYKLKNAVKAASNDEDVWILAACDGVCAKVLAANTSNVHKTVSWNLHGRSLKSMTLTDATHDFEKIEPQGTLPPHSFVVFEIAE